MARPSLLLGPTRRDPLSRQTDEGGLPCDPLGPPYGAALAILAATGGASQAAWNNVFEACCWNGQSPTTAAYAAPQACCQPQQQCTTRYVQRSYYQPVTTYTQRTYYEPVTTYRTSYYYEPVTSYRYSCAYDPCTCRYQQVATPTTSYRLRSQCCPVTSYMQRCQVTPVQSYRQAFYYEPVTSCCQTTVGAPVLTLPAGATAVPAAPLAPAPAAPAAAPPSPQVSEPGSQLPPYSPPTVTEGANPTSNESKQFYQSPSPSPTMPKALDQSRRQPRLGSPQPLPSAPVASPEPPRVRIDRIASLPKSSLQGNVVNSADRTPHSGAKLLFVSADRQGVQQSVTADGNGRFRTTLASGDWLVYVQDGQGRPIFHEKVDLRDGQTRTVTLVSRQK